MIFLYCIDFAFALGREIGLDKLQISFPTPVILILNIIMKSVLIQTFFHVYLNPNTAMNYKESIIWLSLWKEK